MDLSWRKSAQRVVKLRYDNETSQPITARAGSHSYFTLEPGDSVEITVLARAGGDRRFHQEGLDFIAQTEFERLKSSISTYLDTTGLTKTEV